MSNRKYSVLMSVYYKEKPDYLKQSIESMLEQTVKPDEVVVVKDGVLTPELDNIIHEFETKGYISVISLSENQGLGKALNIGLQHCRNQIIARMDTDDISKRDRCEKQLELFMKDESLAIVSSSVAEFDDNPSKINSIKRVPTSHNEIIKYSQKRNPFNHPAVMYKKEEVQNAGGYKHFYLFEDYYLWVRMILNGAKCANIDEPLVYMRADKNMFRRRGGLKYFKSMFSFRLHLKRLGFYTTGNFLLYSSLHGMISLLPNQLRIFIYRKYLRDN